MASFMQYLVILLGIEYMQDPKNTKQNKTKSTRLWRVSQRHLQPCICNRNMGMLLHYTDVYIRYSRRTIHRGDRESSVAQIG